MSQKVIEEGKRIQSLSSSDKLNTGIVMDEVAKDLTYEFCKVVGESRGDILDIGFGLGFSANYFLELGVKSYTCIEIDEQVYQTALEWSKDKPNVTIIKGDWINIIPTLQRKFDGIFMDTYGDDFNKYRQFPMYAKLVANENCCLSLWEYAAIRNPEEINFKLVEVEQKDYELLLNPYHVVCWSYFVSGDFRKDVYYHKQLLLPPELCDELIEQNKDRGMRERTEALVDGIVHARELSYCKPLYNEKLEKIINEKLLSNYKNLNLAKMDILFNIYTEGNLYERHVETIKNIPIGDPNQRSLTYEILLNEEFEGGELNVYDIWLNSDRETYSPTNLKKGEAAIYRPYQHVENQPITSGVRYSLLIHIRNKDREIQKHLI